MWPFSRTVGAFAAAALTMLAGHAHAGASVNLPVGSPVYDELERLEVKGLVKSGLLATRPFSREEAARLIKEARGASGVSGSGMEIIGRLEKEFSWELAEGRAGSYLKPVSLAYSRFLYSVDAPRYPNVNNNGDTLVEGGNFRAGFSAEASLFDTFALYLNPEYRLDGSSRGRLVHGYARAVAGGVELELGRDSMRWGSGYHGNLILTNNARPFDMVKLTSSRPFLLPWVLGRLGPIRPTVFLTRLEEDRDFPNANLLGMRLDLKPTERLQIGLNRVFMFGGEGRRSLDASDWFNVFIASDSAEHESSPINGNQIASIDVSYVYVSGWKYIPFSGIKLYTEWGAEDSSGKTRTPKGKASVIGVYVDEPLWLKNFDFRAELANTARNPVTGFSWYRHNVYSSGYTYYGNVIGHHMGPDAKDLFLRGRYHLPGGGALSAEYDRERSDVHFANTYNERTWLGADASIRVREVNVSGGYGVEKDRRDGLRNNVAWVTLSRPF